MDAFSSLISAHSVCLAKRYKQVRKRIKVNVCVQIQHSAPTEHNALLLYVLDEMIFCQKEQNES